MRGEGRVRRIRRWCSFSLAPSHPLLVVRVLHRETNGGGGGGGEWNRVESEGAEEGAGSIVRAVASR